MARIGPIRRRDLVSCLRRLGFHGPYAGGKHQIMQRGVTTVRLLLRILRDAHITREEWEAL